MDVSLGTDGDRQWSHEVLFADSGSRTAEVEHRPLHLSSNLLHREPHQESAVVLAADPVSGDRAV